VTSSIILLEAAIWEK